VFASLVVRWLVNNLCVFCTECLIEALSWGASDTTSKGYIAINGNKVISTYNGFSGLFFVELDVSSCSPSNIVGFDPIDDTTNADKMADYINSLPLNTVLIGVTADDAQEYLTQNATSALLTIGVNLTGLQYQGKVSFMAQIGQPSKTVAQVAPSGGSNSKITVTMTGKRFHYN
jgi:Interleukin-like EMT inducer